MPSLDSLDASILEQAAEAVIYANRQGVIERWNLCGDELCAGHGRSGQGTRICGRGARRDRAGRTR